MRIAASIIIWVVALFYAYGALVHVANMLSMTGFDWSSAPLKWQVLDIVYLVIDVIVVAGLLLRWKAGVIVFYLAAFSQIVLYTILRSWIIDVPAEFAVSDEQQSYLTGLVVFHCVTLLLITFALRKRSAAKHQAVPAAASGHEPPAR